ncbi:DEAD/DEAH box helicase family protein, partial [Streptococcus pseudopneumoniae]|nr:DEAD/DEAH box helicase family protein [Streptococcus pseudopneumoniae]
MATGLGKSVCFAETMRRWDVSTQGKILLIAHRRELILQAIGHAMRAGLSSGIEMADRHATGDEDVIVASVQSLNA